MVKKLGIPMPWKTSQQKRKKLSHIITWMDLGVIMLSEKVNLKDCCCGMNCGPPQIHVIVPNPSTSDGNHIWK